MKESVLKIYDAIKELRKDSIMISICGNGASGKTKLANELIQLLGEGEVNYVNTDSYLLDSNVRKKIKLDDECRVTANHRYAYFIPGLIRDIEMLEKGMDFFEINEYSTSKNCYARKPINIVEGIGVAFIPQEYFDISIFIYTDCETEYKFRLKRDSIERNIPIKCIERDFDMRRLQFEKVVFPLKGEFNVVLNNKVDNVVIEKFDVRSLR